MTSPQPCGIHANSPDCNPDTGCPWRPHGADRPVGDLKEVPSVADLDRVWSVATLRSELAVRIVERDQARHEAARLRALVGDEDQPGWDGCSRAEAIRQANEFHKGQLEWIERHDARRSEREVALARVAELQRLLAGVAVQDEAMLTRLREIWTGYATAHEVIDSLEVLMEQREEQLLAASGGRVVWSQPIPAAGPAEAGGR